MLRIPLLLLVSLFATVICAQSNEALIEALDEAETDRERYGILYQLAKNYNSTTRQSDIDRAITFGEQAYKAAARTRDEKLTGPSAYLLGQIYLRKRNYQKADSRFRTASEIGMKVGNPDLVLKSVSERSKMATRQGNYRRAATIYGEALDYFTQDGNDIESLRAELERERANLERQRREVRSETSTLSNQLENLIGRQDELQEQNQNLQRKNQTSSQALAERQRELQETASQKAAAEAKVRESREAIANLSREALTQTALAAQAKEQLAEEALSRKEAELQTMQARTARAEAHAQRNYAVGIGGGLFLLALLLYSRFRNKAKSSRQLAAANAQIEAARQRSDDLLKNILPADIAKELKETGKAKARSFPEVTILFSDFVNFTHTSEQLGAENLVRDLDHCFRAFDAIIDRYPDVEKIKTIGDAYMVASGLSSRKSMPLNIVRAALDMQQFLAEEGRKRQAMGQPYFTARVGLHTGPVVAGVVGVTKFAYDIWGDAVNVASRVEGKGEAGRVNISESTYHLVKYSFDCTYRGKVQAKNKGMLDMYFVDREKA